MLGPLTSGTAPRIDEEEWLVAVGCGATGRAGTDGSAGLAGWCGPATITAPTEMSRGATTATAANTRPAPTLGRKRLLDLERLGISLGPDDTPWHR
jgi:hypothetical protein